MKNKTLIIGGNKIEPGSCTNIAFPAVNLYTQTQVKIPIHVFHGKSAGPSVFIVGTIHGDEINSIEILRRLNLQKTLKKIRGTLINIPIINVHGFILQSRYLPDRRDLNRAFPGSKNGSLAARLANLLIEEIISKCQYGIDLHTGSNGRINMPQIRVDLAIAGAKEIARAFDVPVILDAKIRDGSLRAAASELGIPLLVYEAGEALRFNEFSIRAGLRGILNVLNYLGMISLPFKKKKRRHKPIITQTARWVRAVSSGIMQPLKELTDPVRKNETLALIYDPFLINKSQEVIAPFDGIVIGRTNLPLVNAGDAMYNIASTRKLRRVSASLEEILDEVTRYD